MVFHQMSYSDTQSEVEWIWMNLKLSFCELQKFIIYQDSLIFQTRNENILPRKNTCFRQIQIFVRYTYIFSVT